MSDRAKCWEKERRGCRAVIVEAAKREGMRLYAFLVYIRLHPDEFSRGIQLQAKKMRVEADYI
jgi:hypothetical protein